MIANLRKYWKSIVWAIVILILCGLPGNEVSKVKFIDIPYFDKFVHLSLYLVFTLLLISDNNSKRKSNEVSVKAIILATIAAIIYGILIEVLQKYLFINRGAEIWDEVANTLGVLIAIFCYRWINRITDGYL